MHRGRRTSGTRVDTEPYRLNNKQDAIAFANASLGLYGNGTGRIYRTLDGGLHWRLAWRKPGTYVRALEFADDQTAFMGNVGPGYFPDVSDRSPLYVTHDAGSTWAPGRAGIGASGDRHLCTRRPETGGHDPCHQGGRTGWRAGRADGVFRPWHDMAVA